MANMGTTGTINITKDMMDKAITAIDTYQATITNLNTELLAEIDGIIPSSFSGSAATGFKTFYTKNIEPNTGENLTKMLKSLKTFEQKNYQVLYVTGKPYFEEMKTKLGNCEKTDSW